MRARLPTALHAAPHGLLVPATVIAKVGYFLARGAGAHVESFSYGPWLVGTLRPSTDQH
jgi:hypothetical protein